MQVNVPNELTIAGHVKSHKWNGVDQHVARCADGFAAIDGSTACTFYDLGAAAHWLQIVASRCKMSAGRVARRGSGSL